MTIMFQASNNDIEVGSKVESVAQNSQSSQSSSYHENTSTDRSSANSGNNQGTGITTRVNQVAASEIKNVQRTKCLVFVILAIITIGFSLFAYFRTTLYEVRGFENQFKEDAEKLLLKMGTNLVRTLQASDAFVASITSLTSVTNQEWPFVVIPDFAVRTEKIRALSNAVYVDTYHLVQPNQRAEWEAFTARNGIDVVKESIDAIEKFGENNAAVSWPIFRNYTLMDKIHSFKDLETGNLDGVETVGPWMPRWQIQPTIAHDFPPYNWDLSSVPPTKKMIEDGGATALKRLLDTHKVTISDAWMISDPDDEVHKAFDDADARWIRDYLQEEDKTKAKEPISDILYPILLEAHRQIELSYDEVEAHAVVGVFGLAIYWRDTIRNVFGEGTNGLVVVFENPCNPTFTYEINGPNVRFFPEVGDHHDRNFDHLVVRRKLFDIALAAKFEEVYSGIKLDDEFCQFTINVYPSEATKRPHTTSTPTIFACVTVLVFVITATVFLLYDFWVERRQKAVMKTAVTTTALVSSLFPEGVIDQVLPDSSGGSNSGESQPRRLKTFLNDGKDDSYFDQSRASKPIAELFPDTTVCFADIAGFTAWASVREPSHVFTLLETLYGAFDRLAKHHGIFKVETIGDSYVAVCGLPEPRKNHAVAMARFAFACLEQMREKTRELELTLGPGTGDLRLRTGLHSGPTIAGVLRGEKARFQLFGDTVNTAARMESTGIPNKIQVSQNTADLIIAAGKEKWLRQRTELVNAKGKGELQTYWLDKMHSRSASALSSVSDGESESNDVGMLTEFRPIGRNPVKIKRLIDWNVSIFQELLEAIVGHRNARRSTQEAAVIKSSSKRLSLSKTTKPKNVRDEVVETIQMPDYRVAEVPIDTDVKLDPEVTKQLRDYISRIAEFYNNDNSFHNFEHANHVIMSTVKLLQRIASPDVKKKDCETEQDYFNYTFGISSDPLTKFAIVFSALIHDVDHRGVSNYQLTKERDPLALLYGNKSVLEQRSLDLAWSLLQDFSFKELRNCICATPEESERFRQLIVNCVMATDIFDKELKAFRDNRWERAFKSSKSSEDSVEDWNRKATITIECIIQASDVSHTMQHWHVYQKWNECLFREMYNAHKNGRSDKDPSEGWYEGELWFFDNYIIPLATKLRECEVFGVSCDEFLNFANENRREWSVKGRKIVAQMLKNAQEDAETKIGNLNAKKAVAIAA